MRNPLSQNYQIGRGEPVKRRVSWVSHASDRKKAQFQRSPVLGVLPYLCLPLLTQNDEIRHGNTYGEGRGLGGQPRHCICTNASRGLSATAEFLVGKRCLHFLQRAMPIVSQSGAGFRRRELAIMVTKVFHLHIVILNSTQIT